VRCVGEREICGVVWSLEFGFGMGKGEGKWDNLVKWDNMVKWNNIMQ
jgi:hypothetical protein